MKPISVDMAQRALERMSNFHEAIRVLYANQGLEFFEDLGRRNILMSRPQEKFFAEELKRKYNSAHADGKTGQPDILIPEISKEIECKITSKGKSGGWNLQTDYGTLKSKGSIDYLYVLCNPKFDKFSVLYFEDLDCSDFRSPSPGSRGKSQMILWKAMDKCTILWGKIENLSDYNRSKVDLLLKEINPKSKSQHQKLIKRKKYWNTAPDKFKFVLEEI